MPPPRIVLHQSRRFLMTEDGAPFFWLADTAWKLPARITADEAELLLRTRARQGFNVIMLTALSELNGLRAPNPDGQLPFHDQDPARPNERFFELIDHVVATAAELGLYIALIPTWGDKITPNWGDGPAVFFERPDVLQRYCAWLGARYRDASNLVWILGGDRPPLVEDGSRRPPQSPAYDYRPLWRAAAAGLEAGLGCHRLMLYHTWGGYPRTAQQLHTEAWLDVHSMQSGHGGGHDLPVWEAVEQDVGLMPPRPVLDLEPNYEDHPVSPWPSWDPQRGFFREGDVRRQIYRAVFAGACGAAYGHHSVWQFASPRYEPVNWACMYWQEAIERPGANQLIHLRRLMESRPFFERVPDQRLIVAGQGEGRAHLRATRDAHGRYAMVFFPDAAGTATIDLRLLAGPVRAWWFDTHTGMAYSAGEFANTGPQRFTPHLAWHDWVLVLDELAQGFGPPGN